MSRRIGGAVPPLTNAGQPAEVWLQLAPCGPSPAHASGTVEHMHVATGTVRVTVGDETADLVAGDSCSCRTDAPHGVENPDPSAEALIYLIVERS